MLRYNGYTTSSSLTLHPHLRHAHAISILSSTTSTRLPCASQKIKNCLVLLALNPNIHLVASIDRLNAPLLWSASEMLARKVSPSPLPSLAGDAEDGDDSERSKGATRHHSNTRIRLPLARPHHAAPVRYRARIRRPFLHRRRFVRIDRLPALH
ncbi:hypothetical protein PAXINDRAFT_18732 [Paxillus involutus ATCC 200175]|uniref:Origin recognition complex subunit 2 n=1 Tax=Paxillus involutus ATCC 200175 TaxID=664439 RepID=A0A0C9TJP1_PAXIN|nr:hypothetical protein PAXINDRAFT_18732 [Paxillus involutus ATCC 200175]